MFEKNVLRQEIEAALSAPKSDDSLLSEMRKLGLRFMIETRRDQSLADVSHVFDALSERFEVEPLFPSPPFEAPQPGQESWSDTVYVAAVYGVTFDDVTATPWDIAHAVRIEGDFLRVIPEVPVIRPVDPNDAESDAIPCADMGWEHREMRIKGAWAAIEQQGRKPGTNVHIGHPDSGWVDHEVWDQGNLDKARSRNFMPGESYTDARDPLTGAQPGHGNSTASVMVAPRGGSLEGVAPHAVVVPIRCVSTVILYPGQTEVARAVRYAMEQRCRVISLSLGSFDLEILRRAVYDAIAANIIVVAASGNKTFFTVEPASYPGCIGVGGLKYPDKEWEDSAWFPAGTVTVSAPASPVRKAACVHRSTYDCSSGTSYATAFMAGVAALWLSRHFHMGYTGNMPAQYCFREHVRRTIRKLPEVGPGLVGIVNAQALMNTSPPTNFDEVPVDEVPEYTADAETARLLGANRERITGLLAETIFGASTERADAASGELDAWGDEVVHIIKRNPTVRMELSMQAASSTLTPDTFRSFLSPYASQALRRQFAAAENGEAVTAKPHKQTAEPPTV